MRGSSLFSGLQQMSLVRLTTREYFLKDLCNRLDVVDTAEDEELGMLQEYEGFVMDVLGSIGSIPKYNPLSCPSGTYHEPAVLPSKQPIVTTANVQVCIT